MVNFDLEEFFNEQQKKENDRQKMIAEQIRRGCDKCSQWDEYFGCCKCDSL